jgi:hypothetical protein
MKSEYDPGGLKEQADGRNLFLQAVRDCEVESSEEVNYGRQCQVLAELCGEPFRRFQAFYDCLTQGLNGHLMDWDILQGELADRTFSQYQQFYGSDFRLPIMPCGISPQEYFAMRSVREAVAAWANTWNLNKWKDGDSWFFNHTLSILHIWCAVPDDFRTNIDLWTINVDGVELNSLPVQDLRAEIISPSFRCEADLSENETRAEAEKRINKEYEAFQEKRREAEKMAIKYHLDRLQSLEEERGAAKFKAKRNRKHFEWLVRYQIQGWKYGEISEYYCNHAENPVAADLSTVKKYVPLAAKSIGLNLPPRQGKPPKIKANHSILEFNG